MAYTPIVTTVLKSPLATRSISCSICCSVDAGELRMAYVHGGVVGPDCGVGVVIVAVTGGGKREKRDGEGAIKDRYWSRTYLKGQKRSEQDLQDLSSLRTCSTESLVPSCATDAASSSRSARGSGSTKFKWKDSYRDFCKSSAIR